MIVDAAVHPLMPDAEYDRRLGAPWRHAMGLLPSPFGKLYEAPFPDTIAPHTLAERIVADTAVLTPPTRGLLPNPEHLAAVARVTNDWLEDEWLGGRFYGTARLPITDPAAAIAEIGRIASTPRYVGVAVPLRVHAHYGDERYFPIWEAAAAHGLPVFVLDDLASAAEYVRSPVGQPLSWAENDALRHLLPLVHLTSLVVAGVFGRLPGLRFVFLDGGADLVEPLLWRVDKDWRSGRVETPWLEELPSTIALRHAQFVATPSDTTTDGAIYGSRLPFWDANPANGLPSIDLPRIQGEDLA
jgi:predicted TIM-barrel fold metal-dependent hydrolase